MIYSSKTTDEDFTKAMSNLTEWEQLTIVVYLTRVAPTLQTTRAYDVWVRRLQALNQHGHAVPWVSKDEENVL